jgi:hypothetical protein
LPNLDLFELAASPNHAVESSPNYSMPEEAEIATKSGIENIAQFLLSVTKTSLSLNLSKSRRMAVHNFINHRISPGKLLCHFSKGMGRDRVLVIMKKGVESPE